MKRRFVIVSAILVENKKGQAAEASRDAAKFIELKISKQKRRNFQEVSSLSTNHVIKSHLQYSPTSMQTR